MDSNSSSASQAKAPMVIPEDPLISPLYEVIFPFFTPKSSRSSSSTSLISIPNNSNLNVIANPMVNSMGAQISPFLSSTWGELPCHSPVSNRPRPGYFTSLLTSDIATLTTWFASKSHYSYSSSVGFPHPVGGAVPRLGLQRSFDTCMNPCYFPGSSASSSPHWLTNSKYKYMCGACQVYFSTSQALGGHMSYHSKERKGQPLASTVRTTVRASFSSSKEMKRRNKEKRSCMLNRIAHNALDNDKGKINAKSQRERKRSDEAIDEERKKEKARDAGIFKPQQVMEDEKLNEMINEMYNDMDFNYFVGNN